MIVRSVSCFTSHSFSSLRVRTNGEKRSLTMNMSYMDPKTVTLIGIPGLEHVQFWIGFSFFAVCLVALLGNIILLIIIPTEHSLHQPMYIFLAVLAATDIGLCVAIAPKMLAIFWFGFYSMAFDACLAQLFFIHALQGMESGILLAMAFDRYVAICDPLRYTSTLTPFILVSMVLVVAIQATVLVGILPILIKRLHFFQSTVIAHPYCEQAPLLWSSWLQKTSTSIKHVVFS